MRAIILAVVFLIPYVSNAALELGSPFHVEWDEGPLKVVAGKRFEAAINIHIPEDHYLYADKTDLDFRSLEGVRIDEIKFPKTILKEDPYFGKKMEVYTGDVKITIFGHVPDTITAGERELVAVLNLQGCSPKLCLRPEEHEIAFNIVVEAAPPMLPEKLSEAEKGAPELEIGKEGIRSLLKAADFSAILDRGVIFTILIVFLAGILVSLTPCILPIIPVVLLVIGVEAQKKWLKNVLLSLTLVSGIVVVNAMLSLIAVSLGKGLGFLFQQRWFLVIIILFFILMSLAMFGLFEIAPLKRLVNRLSYLGGKGFRGALLAGLGIGLMASPCASPVLIALLTYVAAKQSYLMGFCLLIVFGIGMGLLFIVIGSPFGELAGYLKGGKWMVRVKHILGVILLIPAVFYLRSLVRWDGIFHPPQDAGVPRVEWVVKMEEGLKFAKESNRPMMVEFYADWCPPCRALETKFFRREDIVKITYQMVPVRIDATLSTPEVKEAAEKYNVVGWPVILFLSPEGEVYEDLTVISYDPPKIEVNMREALARARSGSS